MTDLAPGRVVAGKFRLDRLIAQGGMGAVWSAHHLHLEVPVAIKFMSTVLADSAEARVRFEREAKAAAQLRTPHVVQIHDHGVDDDMPYIVMELLEGEDLGARFKREKRLPLGAVARIVAQTCKALRLAHEASIIHRDLKPGNIFLAKCDDEEIVKVLDFGIAKSMTPGMVSESTRTGELLGSPHYMSPEQARGMKTIDHRSDLWSLAVILYRAITGKKPFVGESVGDVIVRICTETAIPPTQMVPGIPPDIDRFFERALSRDVTKRYQNARELAAGFIDSCAGALEPSFPSLDRLSMSGAHPQVSVPPPVPSSPGAPPPMHFGPSEMASPPGSGSWPSVVGPRSDPTTTAPVAAGPMPSMGPSGTLTGSGSMNVPGGARRSALLGAAFAVFSVVLVAGLGIALATRSSAAAETASSGIAAAAAAPTRVAVASVTAAPPEPEPAATAEPAPNDKAKDAEDKKHLAGARAPAAHAVGGAKPAAAPAGKLRLGY